MLAYTLIEFVVSEENVDRLLDWTLHEWQVYQRLASGRRHAHSRVEGLDVYRCCKSRAHYHSDFNLVLSNAISSL